nr:DUF2326 domain-containing protein [Vulcanibacillus modesticaldus]
MLVRFNTHFSDFSEQLYGEKYVFTYNKNWKNEKGSSPFTVSNMSGNPGTGKKRGQIVAFDLAYLKYLHEENIEFPRFIIHDKLENTHINQLETIFNICNKIKGQYIVPILRERIDKIEPALIKQATILELSQDDKFFKID